MDTKQAKGSWFLNLAGFLKNLWNFFRHGIITYMSGNHNVVISVSGEVINLTLPKVPEADLWAALYALTSAIEPTGSKSQVKLRAESLSRQTKGESDMPVEFSIIRPLVKGYVEALSAKRHAQDFLERFRTYASQYSQQETKED